MHSQLKWNTSVECRGCGKQFKAKKSIHGLSKEIAYYRHCFDECEKYRKLGLIHTCCECDRRYLTYRSLSTHCKETGHVKPLNKSNYTCEGCGLVFNSKKYAKHCVEDCDDYRKLNRIEQCVKCNKLFRNKISLSIHRVQVHPKAD